MSETFWDFRRNDVRYSFNDANFESSYAPFPVYLVGAVGWGVAPSHQLTQRGPFQQGDTYVGFRLDPRVMQVPIVVPASSAGDMMRKRDVLARIFRIGDDVCQIGVSYTDKYGNSVDLVIDGHIVGGVMMDTQPGEYNIRASVQFKANDPTWRSFSEEYVVLSGVVAGTPTPYPKPYPVTYGATSIDKTTLISYVGSWDAYPVIQATGPLTNLAVVDTMGHQIVVNGTIAAGDIWTFDLTYGNYSVTDSAGVNRFGDLSISSDLVNWRLYASNATVDFGLNSVSVSATGTTSASQVALIYHPRYIGV